MKFAFFTILFCRVTVAGAETPQAVAEHVISSESLPAYNATNSTEAELNRAAAINSQLQLRTLMLGDSVSEKLRVCYALRIIKDRLGILRIGNIVPADQALLRDQDVLAAFLRRLNEAKK